jgi:hypothetical protein
MHEIERALLIAHAILARRVLAVQAPGLLTGQNAVRRQHRGHDLLHGQLLEDLAADAAFQEREARADPQPVHELQLLGIGSQLRDQLDRLDDAAK